MVCSSIMVLLNFLSCESLLHQKTVFAKKRIRSFDDSMYFSKINLTFARDQCIVNGNIKLKATQN
jgi:hypothetical protein